MAAITVFIDKKIDDFACRTAGLYGPAVIFLGFAMPPRANPSKLNPLQLKTLTLLQAIAQIPGAASRLPGGEVVITQFPNAHGDHFHLGDATVASRDATGLHNEAVWNALTRKGLVRAEYPHQIALTGEGLAYDTGIAGEILHKSGH